jgi:hypothetical protein
MTDPEPLDDLLMDWWLADPGPPLPLDPDE